ncbi:hypothetical protein J3R82DRAFT_4283 [Butyriboletus roseoflavus]|nr:hypothetical protein J3R82DRAFT_4283 [Butyriboletus roseoflavus]
MLSAHYTGNSPVHPHPQHTPLHGHIQISSNPGQQAQYTQHQHAMSSLLPTPPSSPPTIGMHPVESTISLLDSLVAFYHQERMWVYRTRAQLEMGLLHLTPDSQPSSVPIDAELDDDPASPGQLQTRSASSPDSGKTAENASPSPPTKWLKRKKAFNLRLEGISSTRSMLPTVARGGISKHAPPHTQHRARQSSNLNPASVPASSHQNAIHGSTTHTPHSSVSMASPNTTVSFYPPTAINAATTLTSPYLSHPSFQFSAAANQQPLTPGISTSRFVSTPAHHTHSGVQPSQLQSTHTGPLVLGAGGREPTVQILEMFERMMQARMESCERVTRMVREANKPGGIGVRGTGVTGGVGLGSVGGPVGGFGGPVGLPVGTGPQGIVGGYSHVQGTVEGQDPEMIPTQTPTQQGFPMGVNMG